MDARTPRHVSRHPRWIPEHRGISDGCQSAEPGIEASRMDTRAPRLVSRHPRWIPERRGIPNGCQNVEKLTYSMQILSHRDIQNECQSGKILLHCKQRHSAKPNRTLKSQNNSSWVDKEIFRASLYLSFSGLNVAQRVHILKWTFPFISLI